MKTTISLFLFLPVFALCFKMQTKKKIIFFGDSITESGVKRGGYINELDTILQQKGQDKNYELIGSGISANKVYDLYLRLEEDVLSKKPDAVVIWIGVNDVWHKKLLGTGTDADKFEQFYNAIIKKLQEKNISVFVCTPAVIGEKKESANELDDGLNKYSTIIRKITKSNNCPLIDLRQEFLNYLQENNPENKDRGILTTDGVHLNERGNHFVAQKLSEVLRKDFIK